MLYRISWADALKGFLMILVVLGHSIQAVVQDGCYNNHLWNLIYSFHMPAFIAVSGYLAYGKTRVEGGAILRRAKQLLVPYFLWGVISFIIRGNYSLKTLLELILYPGNYLWFLWALFWIFTIFHGCLWVSKTTRIDKRIVVATCCMLMMAITSLFSIKIMGFHLIAYYYIFYIIGQMLRKYSLPYKQLLFIPLVLLWMFLAWSWEMHSLPDWFPAVKVLPESIIQFGYRCFTALIGICALIIAGESFLKDKDFPALQYLGTISLGIYAVHVTFINEIAAIFNRFFCINNGWLIFITFASTLIITIPAVSILMRNRYTARFLLGKIKNR